MSSSRRSRQMATSSSRHPPQLESNIRVTHRFRFVSTNGALTGVTGESLAGAVGAVGTLLNSLVSVSADFVRVSYVEMWTPPAAQGDSATCSINWSGTANSPDVEFSDTTVSVTDAAHVRSVPPRNSLAGFWQAASSNTTVFSLIAPPGTIIDVRISFILSDSGALTQTIAVATAALGETYYLSLDPSFATHYYVPQSLNTTH